MINFLKFVAKNRLAAFGGILLLIILTLSILAPILPLKEPNITNTADRFMVPFEGGHVLGTDHLGLAEQICVSKEAGTLFSLHMKATMMKVSDPIIFGHCVSVFYRDVFEKHAKLIAELGVDVNNGLGDLYSKIDRLPTEERAQIEADIAAVYETAPDIAMVDSDKGITNLHVPSDVIIDASMPAAIRSSGQMWNKDGEQQDTNFVIPDRCYSGVYAATVDFCKKLVVYHTFT